MIVPGSLRRIQSINKHNRAGRTNSDISCKKTNIFHFEIFYVPKYSLPGIISSLVNKETHVHIYNSQEVHCWVRYTVHRKARAVQDSAPPPRLKIPPTLHLLCLWIQIKFKFPWEYQHEMPGFFLFLSFCVFMKIWHHMSIFHKSQKSQESFQKCHHADLDQNLTSSKLDLW